MIINIKSKLNYFFAIFGFVVFGWLFSAGSASAISSAFTSQAINTGQNNVSWGVIKWNTTQPSAATKIELRAKSGSTVSISDFASCPIIATITSANAIDTTGVSLTANGNTCVVAGDRYLKYEATLTSTDQTVTPSLNSVDVYYNYYSSQTLTSSAYNTMDGGNVLAQIAWTQDSSLPSGASVKFQARSAPDNSGIPGTWSDWMGSDSTSGTYFFYTSSGDKDSNCSAVSGVITCNVPSGHALKSGSNDRWIQYKVWLNSSGATTPTLYDITMVYVINAPPCIGSLSGVVCISDPVVASQNADGTVSISYNLSDSDSSSFTVYALADIGVTLNEVLSSSDTTLITLSSTSLLPSSGTIQIDSEQISYTSKHANGTDLNGTITRGANNTLATSHSSGAAIWIKGSTFGGGYNVGAAQTAGTGKSITWTIKTDLPGVYVGAVPGAKIRVAVNDGNAANQVGNGDSTGFALDTKNPAYGDPVMVIDSTASSVTLANITVTEASTLSVRYSNASNVNGSTCVADIAGATYESLAGNSKAWTLSPNANGISTVCFQAKDNYSNEEAVTFVSTPAKPTGMRFNDVSNPGASPAQYKGLVWWTTVASPLAGSFTQYNIYRSTDDGATYSSYRTVSGLSANFCFDKGAADTDCSTFGATANLTNTQKYYYKVRAESTTGYSPFSDPVYGTPDGSTTGEASADSTAPTLSSGPSPDSGASFGAQTTATITWTTNEASTSLINYGTNSTTLGSMAGNAEITDNSTPFDHSVALSGLTAGTTYYYQILSADASGNLLKSPATPPTGIHSFATQADSQAPVLNGAPAVVPGRSSATIFWTTAEESTTQLKYIASVGGSASTDPLGGTAVPAVAKSEKVLDHYIAIGSGTLSSVSSIRIDSGGSGYTLAPTVTITGGGCTTAPTATAVITADAVTGVSVDTAGAGCASSPSIAFTGGEGTGASATAEITFNNGLTSGATYNYQILSADAAGNTLTYPSSAPFLQFTTLSSTSDSTPPTINSISSGAPGPISATISFTVSDDSGNAWVLVEYGASSDLSANTLFKGTVSDSPSAPVSSIALSGLIPGNTYYYRVYAGDSQGNVTISNIASFNTEALSIASVPVVFPSRSSAVITWSTNGPSDSRVEYGTSSALSGATFTACPEPNTAADSCTALQDTDNKVANHIVSLSLSPDTTYYYRVLSRNGAGTYITSSIGTFETTSGAKPVIAYDKATQGPSTSLATITQAIDDAATTSLTVSSASSLAPSGIVQVGNEKIRYASITDNTLNALTRGANGTTASSHSNGDSITTLSDNTAYITFSSEFNNAAASSLPLFLSVEYEEAAASQVVAPATFTKESANPSAIATNTKATIGLEGLSSNTKYFYKLKARDIFGNAQASTSDEYYFTTTSDAISPSPITTLSSSSITPSSITLTWTSTGDDNNTGTATSYDLRYSTTDITLTDWSTATQVSNEPLPLIAGSNQEITITGLTSGTYYFAIKSKDESNNESNISNIHTVIIPQAIDITAPTIDTGPTTSDKTSNSIKITWTTNDEASSSLVDYGTNENFSYGYTQGDSTILTPGTTHIVTLVGLSPSTTYYYRAKSIDNSGNIGQKPNSNDTSATKASYNFTTDGTSAGTQPAITVDPTATKITATSFRIDWSTDINSDSIVSYGVNGSDPTYPLQAGSSTQTQAHQVVLSSLSPTTAYNYQVKSTNGDKQAAKTGTFTTEASNDTVPPIFSKNPTVTSVTASAATVTWSTTEKSSSLVLFGTATSSTANYPSSQGNSTDRVLDHFVSLSNLTASAKYYFRVKSVDSSNNATTSEEYSFTTTAGEAVTCPSVSCGGGGSSSSVAVDTTAPTISDIKVSEITATSAKVEWKTNENGTSFVEYGKDNKYGTTIGNYDNVKSHIVNITNLEPDADYNYRVLTADSSGNLAKSENLTFKTLKKEDLTKEQQKKETQTKEEVAQDIQKKIEVLIKDGMDEQTVRDIIAKATQPPNIGTEGPSIKDTTNSSTRILWKTDRKSNSVARFKVKEDNINPEDSTYLRQFGNFTELVTDHQVILTNLLSGTTYQYQVQSSDIMGNTGKSLWKEFTTSIIPNVFDVIISDINLNSVIVNWKTNTPSSSEVEYGKTTTYTLNESDKDKAKVTKHIIKLINLSPGTTYHYRVRGIDSDSNPIVSDDYTFTTFTLPKIEVYTVEKIEEKSILINWKTNVPTDSTIKYTDPDTNETRKQTEDNLSNIHNFNLRSLDPGKEYTIQIQGRDIYANPVVSDDFKVKTNQDTTPPVISQIKTETAVPQGSTDKVQTIISWKTNEQSTSKIYWEEGITDKKDLPNSTPEDKNYTTNHIMVITSFKPASVYRFRVESADNAGNTALSSDFTILIPEKKKSVIQIIINNFENTFGWTKNIKF